MGFSYEGDTIILCRLLGFAVNSFDSPPQLGAVGPVIYALNGFSPLSSFVVPCRFGELIIHCQSALLIRSKYIIIIIYNICIAPYNTIL